MGNENRKNFKPYSPPESCPPIVSLGGNMDLTNSNDEKSKVLVEIRGLTKEFIDLIFKDSNDANKTSSLVATSLTSTNTKIIYDRCIRLLRCGNGERRSRASTCSSGSMSFASPYICYAEPYHLRAKFFPERLATICLMAFWICLLEFNGDL